ncbi:MAG: hypothetical protein GY953_51195, partial [bacterium]|nr:hypothetical protein [bacterium]
LSLDREVSKAGVDALHRVHRQLYGPVPKLAPILPASVREPQTWRHTQKDPKGGWTEPGYDDSRWKSGPGPFGNTSNHAIGTTWKSEQLFLRKRFEVGSVPEKAALSIYFYGQSAREIGNARVYLNGKLIHENQTRQKKPELRVSEIMLRPGMVELIREGGNTLAVEVRADARIDPRLFDIGLERVTEGDASGR